MKTLLLTIGFSLGGILTSLAQAQAIPMTIDSTQSSVSVSIAGSASNSQLSGTTTLDIQSSEASSGDAQITDLNLVLDESLSASLSLGLLAASTSAGDVTISMVTPGAQETISDTSFSQLANLLTLGGELSVIDQFGVAGGSQTIDFSTIEITPSDFSPVNVTQSGDVITISSSFTFTGTLNLGIGPVPMVVAGTFVASGDAPVSVLPGDVNLDNVVDGSDIMPFIAILSTGEFQAEADINQNEAINFLDIFPFIQILMQ